MSPLSFFYISYSFLNDFITSAYFSFWRTQHKYKKMRVKVVWFSHWTEEEDEDEEEDDEEVKDRSQPRPSIWLDVESSREAAHWLPWRPDKSKGQSEEDCDDPDRQVINHLLGAFLLDYWFWLCSDCVRHSGAVRRHRPVPHPAVLTRPPAPSTPAFLVILGSSRRLRALRRTLSSWPAAGEAVLPHSR